MTREYVIRLPGGCTDTNDDRAAKVRPLAEVFAEHSGNDTLAQAIRDMVVDLCHLIDRLGPDEVDEFFGKQAPAAELARALSDYEHERDEEVAGW